MGDRIQGHEKRKDMTCPHCHMGTIAELVEVRIGYAVYECKKCDKRIQKTSFIGHALDILGALNPFR